MPAIKLLILVVSYVGLVSGSTQYDQPATGASKRTQVVANLENTPDVYFAGGDVCKICKVLATIAHAGIISNTTTGYQDMRQFCFHLENYMLDEISENICLTQMDILAVVIKSTGITNPVKLCSNAAVGACGSVKEGQPRFEMDSHMTDLSVNKSGCGCMKYNCGCCAHVEFDKIKINDTVCTNFSYLPDDYGISFTVTLDDKTLINKPISARNPPPICVGVPKFKLADICLRFTKLNVTNSSFSGCVEIGAKMAGNTIGEKQLGCFKIPLKEEHLGVGPVPLRKDYIRGGPMPLRKVANTSL